VEIRVPRKMAFGHRGVKFVDCKRGRGRGGAIRKSDNFKSGRDPGTGKSSGEGPCKLTTVNRQLSYEWV